MGSPPGGKIRVLYVDGEPDVADPTARSLEHEHDQFIVDTATTGSAGLDRLGDDIDCIVSGYDLPEMDGIAFLEAVRAEYPGLPFILFTDHGSEDVASEAISAGVTDYLQKESDRSQHADLANRIDEAVSQYDADLFEKAQNLADVGAWEYDFRTGEVYWTDEVAAIYGLSPDHDPSLEEAFEFYHPEDRPTIREAFERARTRGEPYDLTLRLITADGDQRWVRTRGDPQFDGDEPVRIRGSIQDITTQREREAELRQYEAIVEALDDAVYAVDQDGTVKYVNERYAEMKNTDREEIIGTSMREWASDEELDRIYDLVSELEAGELDVAELEYEFRTVDGKSIPAEVRFTDLEFPDGQQGRVGVIRDVSERKRRQHELERKTRAIEEAPIGITMTDPDRRDNPIIYANEKFLEITGYSREAVLGRNHRFLQGDRTDPEPVATLREAIDAEEPATAELRNYRKDGTEFWNHVMIAPVEGDDGTVTNYVGFQRDVTERKQREHELQRQNEYLEQFASIVSHDLRTPLSVAEGRLEFIKEDCDSPHVEDLDHALERISSLLEKLLTLARTSQGVTETKWTNLDSIVREAWQTVETPDLTLAVDGNCQVHADPDRLRQLLENVFENSLDHAGGDTTVTVGSIELVPTMTRAQDDTYRGFYVADDGPGIPDELRDDVLEWGFSTESDGTGFGLAIVDQVAQAHDWEITVTESRDGGVRFEFTGPGFRQPAD